MRVPTGRVIGHLSRLREAPGGARAHCVGHERWGEIREERDGHAPWCGVLIMLREVVRHLHNLQSTCLCTAHC